MLNVDIDKDMKYTTLKKLFLFLYIYCMLIRGDELFGQVYGYD